MSPDLSMTEIMTFLDRAIATKSRLLDCPGEKGTFDCPKCGAKVTVVLVGPKHHVRAACETKDCLWVLE